MKKVTTIIFSSLFFFNSFSQVSKTVNCSAGNMIFNFSNSEKLNVTDLTVTGTMDARDFRFLNDSLSALVNLDLAGVSIVAYEGSDGTQNTNRTYLDDELPSSGISWKLQNVILPNTIKIIGSNAFGGNDLISRITIPASVIKIDNFAFSSCGVLDSVVIPGTVDSVMEMAFNYCQSMKSLTIEDGVKFIDKGAFYYCTAMDTLNIPASVTSIGEDAFYYCTGLKYAKISGGTKSIGSDAFYYCQSLETVIFENCIATINYGAFYYNTSLKTLVLGNGVQSIGDQAFYYCISLKDKLIIPASLKTIGANAFYDCQKLEGLEFENGINKIGNSSFNKGSMIQGTLTIPESVDTIDVAAFGNCKSLRTIILPATIKSIGSVAFGWCDSVEAIYSYATTPLNIDNKASFLGIDTINCILYVPEGTKNLYSAAAEWKRFQTIVEMSISNVSHTEINFNETGGSQEIEIVAIGEWVVRSDVDWISISQSTGSDNATITITVLPNSTTNERTGTITIELIDPTQLKNGSLKTITISQEAQKESYINNFNYTESPVIYPNPAPDYLSVSQDASIRISSLSGILLIETDLIDGQMFSIENLSTGIYNVELISENKTTFVTLIKQ